MFTLFGILFLVAGLLFLVAGLLVIIRWPSQRGEVKRLQHLPDRGVDEEVLITGIIAAQSPISYRGFVIIERSHERFDAPHKIRPPFVLRSDGREIQVRGRSIEEAFKMRGAARPSILQRLTHAEGVRALKGRLQRAGRGFENYRVEWGRSSFDDFMGLMAGDTVTVHGLAVSDEEIAATEVFAGDREAYLAYSRRVFWLQPLLGLLCIVGGLFALSWEILDDSAGISSQILTALCSASFILFTLMVIGFTLPLRRGRLTPLASVNPTRSIAMKLIVGTLALVMGLGASFLVVKDTQTRRLQSLPVLSRSSELQAYQGRKVFLEGPIAPGSAPRYKGFVVYQLYEAEEVRRGGDELRWQLLETHTPAFELELNDGRVLVTGNYEVGRTGSNWVVPFPWAKLEIALAEGDSIAVLGIVRGQALEASTVFGGTREEYIASQREEWLWFMLVGGVFSLVGVWLLASGVKQLARPL